MNISRLAVPAVYNSATCLHLITEEGDPAQVENRKREEDRDARHGLQLSVHDFLIALIYLQHLLPRQIAGFDEG